MIESLETHASLILRLHDRANQQAWCEFVEIYQPLIYRLARYKGLQHADAEDGRFRTWLQTIARNRIVNALSRQAADRASGEVRAFGFADRAGTQIGFAESSMRLPR
jgi:RNA polymerase sigma-70 factor (ECF subfamily)